MKKVLAWAVALALVLSSFTMAFADQAKTSKDFKDASQIQYTEAVDVMVATGVINGYPDGTFGPQKTVKRSEMAKMISVMLEGGEDIGDQYKTACPFADSKDHWAAGYIAYCAAEHIIDGRSADVFDPEAEVTGTEVAKMALTSLGYDSKIQGYTGENWAANVLKDAKKNNLFKGLASDFVPGNPCSREAAAQILFNCLKANMVEYENGTSVSVGDDVNVVVSSKIQNQTWPEGEKPDPADDNKDGVKQLYEEVFGGDLAKTNDDDESGRPAHEWTYDGDDVGTYPDSASMEFTANDSPTFEKALTEEDSAMADKFFKAKKQENVVTSMVINGMEIDSDNTSYFYDIPAISLGDKVELFDLDEKSGDLEAYKVVITKYFPAQITGVETDLDEEVLEEHAAEVTLKVFAGRDSDEFTLYDDEIPNFDASTYVEDAVIAVAPDFSEMEGPAEEELTLLDSYVAEELVTGTVTKIKANTVTIDGTAYDLTEVYAAVDGKAFAAKEEYTVYDYNGYAFASEQTSEETETFYGVLLKYNDSVGADDFGDGAVAKVKIFNAKGEEEVLTLAEDETVNADMNSLVSYELNEDGEALNITPANIPNKNWTGQAMKNGGILYGQEVSEDVVAFANTADEGEDAEWTVYDFDALEAADAVDISAYFDDEGALVALMVGSLEETSDTLALVTAVDRIQNADGDAAYEITAFVEGKEATYETKKADDALNAMYEAFQDSELPAELAVLTFDGDLVKAAKAATVQGVETAGEDFPKDVDAVFYGEGSQAVDGILPVIEKNGNNLNVGSEDYIDNQSVAGATVYYLNSDGELELSSLSKIKAGKIVILMQISEDSSTWDTVFFTDAN